MARSLGVVFAPAFLLTALSAIPAWAQTYGPYPEQTYATCGHPGAATAILLIHGGGDVRGDYRSAPNPAICQYLGQHGMFVVAVNYRLATAVGQGWPAQWQDVQLGVRWLRSRGHATVGLVGWSAGGYNVLGATFMYGTIFSPATDPLNEAHEYLASSSVPDFAVDISGFSDLSDTGLPFDIEPALVQGMSASDTKAIQDATASPITYVHPNSPRLLIIHGAFDNIVPVGQAVELKAKLLAAGCQATLSFTSGKHVFLGLTATGQNMLLEQVAAFAGYGHRGVPPHADRSTQ